MGSIFSIFEPISNIFFFILFNVVVCGISIHWVVSKLNGTFSKNLNRIFQNLTVSMSSGMQNAQNFAAIISSMVLEPSFFDHFFDFGFSRDVFPQKGALGKVGAAAGGGGAPLLGAPGHKN